MRRLLCSIGLVACGGVGDAQLRLRTAVNAKQDKLDACYTRSLTRDADGKGAMQLLLHVNQSDGVVDPVTVTSSEITDPKLAKCVRAALGGPAEPGARPGSRRRIHAGVRPRELDAVIGVHTTTYAIGRVIRRASQFAHVTESDRTKLDVGGVDVERELLRLIDRGRVGAEQRQLVIVVKRRGARSGWDLENRAGRSRCCNRSTATALTRNRW